MKVCFVRQWYSSQDEDYTSEKMDEAFLNFPFYQEDQKNYHVVLLLGAVAVSADGNLSYINLHFHCHICGISWRVQLTKHNN